MLRKVAAGIGLLGTLAAAEGLNRFGSFVHAFRGSDASFYTTFLVVSVVAGAVLFAFILGKANFWVKWLTAVAVAGSAALMLAAPSFPVLIQIEIGLVLTLMGLLAVAPKKRALPPAAAS
jgi:hypothetical protein